MIAPCDSSTQQRDHGLPLHVPRFLYGYFSAPRLTVYFLLSRMNGFLPMINGFFLVMIMTLCPTWLFLQLMLTVVTVPLHHPSSLDSLPSNLNLTHDYIPIFSNMVVFMCGPWVYHSCMDMIPFLVMVHPSSMFPSTSMAVFSPLLRCIYGDYFSMRLWVLCWFFLCWAMGFLARPWEYFSTGPWILCLGRASFSCWLSIVVSP